LSFCWCPSLHQHRPFSVTERESGQQKLFAVCINAFFLTMNKVMHRGKENLEDAGTETSATEMAGDTVERLSTNRPGRAIIPIGKKRTRVRLLKLGEIAIPILAARVGKENILEIRLKLRRIANPS
jgi:hypothetical protein